MAYRRRGGGGRGDQRPPYGYVGAGGTGGGGRRPFICRPPPPSTPRLVTPTPCVPGPGADERLPQAHGALPHQGPSDQAAPAPAASQVSFSPAPPRQPAPQSACMPALLASSAPSLAALATELQKKLFVSESETALAPPAADAQGTAVAGVDDASSNLDLAPDVAINPESKSRQTKRDILNELIKLHGKTALDGKLPAYDGRKILHIDGALSFGSEAFVVILVDPKKEKERAKTEFIIKNQIAGRTDLYHLQQFLRGRQKDMPQETIQVLDVVLRESSSWKSRFLFSTFGHKGNIGEGLECWRGYYQKLHPIQMALSLNIDISSTSFFKPVTVIKFLDEFLNRCDTSRPLSDRDRVKMKKALRRVVHRRATQMLAQQGVGNQLQLLIIILPDVSGSYGKIQSVCGTGTGIAFQCCLPKHASRPNKQCLENLALKINVKIRRTEFHGSGLVGSFRTIYWAEGMEDSNKWKFCHFLAAHTALTNSRFRIFYNPRNHVGWDESNASERQPRVSLWEIEPLTTSPMYPSPSVFGFNHQCSTVLPSMHESQQQQQSECLQISQHLAMQQQNMCNKVQFFVSLGGRSLSTQQSLEDTTVKDLIEHCCQRTGIRETEKLYAVLCGKELIAEELLSHYPIRRDSTIDLRSRLRGGQTRCCGGRRYKTLLGFYHKHRNELLRPVELPDGFTEVELTELGSILLASLVQLFTSVWVCGKTWNGRFDRRSSNVICGRVRTKHQPRKRLTSASIQRDSTRLAHMINHMFVKGGIHPPYLSHLLKKLRTLAVDVFTADLQLAFNYHLSLILSLNQVSVVYLIKRSYDSWSDKKKNNFIHAVNECTLPQNWFNVLMQVPLFQDVIMEGQNRGCFYTHDGHGAFRLVRNYNTHASDHIWMKLLVPGKPYPENYQWCKFNNGIELMVPKYLGDFLAEVVYKLIEEKFDIKELLLACSSDVYNIFYSALDSSCSSSSSSSNSSSTDSSSSSSDSRKKGKRRHSVRISKKRKRSISEKKGKRSESQKKRKRSPLVISQKRKSSSSFSDSSTSSKRKRRN